MLLTWRILKWKMKLMKKNKRMNCENYWANQWKRWETLESIYLHAARTMWKILIERCFTKAFGVYCTISLLIRYPILFQLEISTFSNSVKQGVKLDVKSSAHLQSLLENMPKEMVQRGLAYFWENDQKQVWRSNHRIEKWINILICWQLSGAAPISLSNVSF